MKKLINPWTGMEAYFCYGCCPDNPNGLHMEFYEDGDDIVAFWEPSNYVQSWINTLHGGIQTTLMDELGGWVIFRKMQTSGVTSRLEARFIKSISTEEPRLTIRGRITDQKRNAVFIDSEIYNSADELCASAKMVYFVMNPEKAEKEMHFCRCKAEGEE